MKTLAAIALGYVAGGIYVVHRLCRAAATDP